MTKQPDLYAILGVPPSATQGEISHAYRALLRRYHPDTRAPTDETAASDTALRQVLAAYSVLHDPDRRAEYDRETQTPAHHARRRPQQPPSHYGEYGQWSIIAGPVRWHRAP